VARPRQFDQEAVLDAIVGHFWAHGYKGTSVRHLEEVSGLGTASLYNSFGDKLTVFLAALERYSEHRTRGWILEIERITSPAARIRAFVDGIIESALQDPDRMGCLVINTAIELGPHDPEVAAIVAGHLAEVEAFFRRNLEAALAAGEVQPSLSAQDAARSFSALMFGLRVLARTRPDRAMMEGAARPLLALLGDAPTPADLRNTDLSKVETANDDAPQDHARSADAENDPPCR
jgi:TetR/AcrR family transcriptional regulator, transcriptional repressor for nem operon